MTCPLSARFNLTQLDSNRWSSQLLDVNQNGMAYGGLIMGQAMRALTLAIPPERTVTTMQLMFLQGGVPTQALETSVKTLQLGRRFASFEIQGNQGERLVYRALGSCATPITGPQQPLLSTAPENEIPEEVMPVEDIPDTWMPWAKRMGGYGVDDACIDLRIPDAQRQLSGNDRLPNFRFWVKTTQAIANNDSGLHVSAFAYLSDWWINFCMMRPHLAEATERGLQVSSLNHSIWLHDIPRSDDWIHVQTTGLQSSAGHGLALAHYHDRHGRPLATATQDCLLIFRDD